MLTDEKLAHLRSAEMRLGRKTDHLGTPMNNRFRKRLKSAHTRSIGIHKRRAAEEIRAAERVAGNELRLYGYEVRGP